MQVFSDMIRSPDVMNRETDPDAELVFKAAAGDRKAFASLVRSHYNRLFRLVWRMVGSREDAEDIVQDVCFTLATRIDTFRGESKVSTWLAGIAINAARDFLRRRKARMNTLEGYAAVVNLFPQADEHNPQRALWLAGALGRLKDDLRETVILVAGEGLSHAEAAEVLNVTENTVSWRMFEARKALSREGIAEVFHD
jgi:RNA polymerase sigma-70 factor (ECF subfamily)